MRAITVGGGHSGGAPKPDLIAWDNNTLVIIEVKSRKTDEFGPPERAFDKDKQHQVQTAARQYARRAGVPIEQVR